MTSLAKPVTEFPHKGFKYLKLIHQSPHYIAVYKPAHTTCQDEPDNPSSLSNLLRRKTPELFTAREHPFHAPKGVHRLDLQVTGCVLYGTSAYGTRQLAKNFRKRTVQKGYLAILSKLDAVNSQLDQADSGTITTDDCSTRWNVLARVPDGQGQSGMYLCWLRPHEGRNHQLRIHAARDLKAAVMFDKHYARLYSTPGHTTANPEELNIQQQGEGIALHCAYMSFKLGLDQQVVSALPPDSGIWSRLARRNRIDWKLILEQGAHLCSPRRGHPLQNSEEST